MALMCVCNTCAEHRADPRYVPLIDTAVAALLEIFGERVREIRLQGSVAR